MRVAGERDQVEGVVRIQAVERSAIASFALSIGKPLIEPEVSITKTSSFGRDVFGGDAIRRLQDRA